MKKYLFSSVVCALFLGCTTTTTTTPDGTVTSTRRPDPKSMRALQGAVETIGAAAAKAAIDQMMEQQNAR